MSIKKQTTKKRATKARATTAKKTKRTPKAKTSRAKASKSKLAGITQTNGKQYEESIETVRKLEELLEVRKTNPFGTADARIFNENIARMNLSDMQELAVRAGVFPSGNKTVLKNKLLFVSFINIFTLFI